jgi:hypothetical protein
MKTLLPIAILFCAVFNVPAQTWTQTTAPTNGWYSIASSADGTKLVAVADSGPIYMSSDSGTTWLPLNAPDNDWSSVACSADGNLLLAAGAGLVDTSIDSGGTWNSNAIPWTNAGNISVASSADGSNLVAAVTGVGIFTSTNAGGVWISNIIVPPGLSPHAAWISVATSVNGTKSWAVEDGGAAIFISTNSGVWNATTAFNGNWQAVAPSADGTRLVGAVYLTGIYTSTNSGSTWNKRSAPPLNWQAVASSADGSKLIASTGALYGSYGPGPIYTSADSGSTWISNNAPLQHWASVASSADGCKLAAVAYGGGIWTLQSTPAPLLNITPTNGLRLSWIIPSTNLVLQQNLDLPTTSWVTLTNPPAFNLTNLQNEVILSPTNPNGFYRLATP